MESKGFFVIFFLIVFVLFFSSLYFKGKEDGLSTSVDLSVISFSTASSPLSTHGAVRLFGDIFQKAGISVPQRSEAKVTPQVPETVIYSKQGFVSTLASLPSAFYAGLLFIIFGTCLVVYATFFFSKKEEEEE